MKRLFSIYFLIFFCFPVIGQSYLITGYITDSETGNPLSGAHVMLGIAKHPLPDAYAASDGLMLQGKLGYGSFNTFKFNGAVGFRMTRYETTNPGPINSTDTTFQNPTHYQAIERGFASVAIENKYAKTEGAFANYGGYAFNNIDTDPVKFIDTTVMELRFSGFFRMSRTEIQALSGIMALSSRAGILL